MDSSTSISDESSNQHSHADSVRPGARVVIVYGGGQVSEVLNERQADWTLLTLTKSLLDDLDQLAPDAVIIDLSISVDLVRVCRDIRSRSTACVIALGDTPGDDDLAATEVLRAGADDYLSRNHSNPRLVARINATPIASADATPSRGQCVGDVEIDDTVRVVRVAGDVVPCPPSPRVADGAGTDTERGRLYAVAP